MKKEFLLDLIITILMEDFDTIRDALKNTEHPKINSVLDKLNILKRLYEDYKSMEKSKK